jgi:LCP family protein required for cell wall assembly
MPQSDRSSAPPLERRRPTRVRKAVLVPLLLPLVLLEAWTAPVQPLWVVDGRMPGLAVIAGRPTAGALSEVPADSRRPRILLLVGSDRRTRRSARLGHLTGERADSVVLVELIPALRRVQVLSLPRDLRVEVGGLGPGKLNSALTYGGPSAMVHAVRRLTGLPIHHYLELDFAAVATAVDAVGGVNLYLPSPARDLVTGFRARRGVRRLDGRTAVAYVRSRQYEELRDGAWTPTDAGDLGRIHRQQRLLLALRQRLARPPGAARLLRTWFGLAGHVTVDSRLSVGDAWWLFRALTSWPLDERGVRTLPTRPATDPASVVSPFPPFHLGAVRTLVPREPAASALLEAFRTGQVLSTAHPREPDR